MLHSVFLHNEGLLAAGKFPFGSYLVKLLATATVSCPVILINAISAITLVTLNRFNALKKRELKAEMPALSKTFLTKWVLTKIEVSTHMLAT